MRRVLTAFALVVVVLLGGLAVGFAAGVFGVPSVTGVHNEFGAVNESATVIETDLHVRNPNPVGVTLGGTTADYTVRMNGLPMANGTKEGLAIPRGNGSLQFTTVMSNERIPAWWYTHVGNDETTQVTIDANVSSSLAGDRSVSLDQEREIETDVLAGFESDETRSVDANQPLVEDPVLYVNSTDGEWDRANLTRERTPMDLRFEVYNPKRYPYAISRIGYTVTMNDVTVGEGETDSGQILAPRDTSTIRANTVIRNERLDEWWVTHLERGQTTDLRIDFYLIFEVQGERFRVDPDEMAYSTVIETDVFGTKDGSEDPPGESDDDAAGTETGDGQPTADDGDVLEEGTDLPGDTENATDDGVLG